MKHVINALWALSLVACSAVTTYESGAVQDYVLEPAGKPAAAVLASEISILVAEPRARAGFGTRAMMYQKRDYALSQFARNQWAASPARMLGPLLAEALEHSGRFRAVLSAATPGHADWRLDTEDVRLVQHFDDEGSWMQLSLRATLTDNVTRDILFSRELEARVPAPSPDPYGGVQAANRATVGLLKELVSLCAQQLPVGMIDE